MIKTKAIVLNRKKFNNNDALICLYTLDLGKVSLIARGLQKSRSKLAGHLEPLNLVELMIIKGRERNYVGSAINEKSFLNIKSDYDKIMLAGQGLKFLNDLTFNDEADFDIFLILKEFLIDLNERDNNLSLLFFKLKVLKLLGYDFNFSFCSICGKKKANFLDYFDKEVLCGDCLKKESIREGRSIKIETRALKLKEDILSSDFCSLEKIKSNEKERESLYDFVDTVKKIV